MTPNIWGSQHPQLPRIDAYDCGCQLASKCSSDDVESENTKITASCVALFFPVCWRNCKLIFVLLRKTSVDKPLLEYMSKNTIQDNVQCTRVDGSQEH